MSLLQMVNLALRALMEIGSVAGFGYWGYRAGHTPGTKFLLALGAPALGFGIWGAVDFRRAGARPEMLRLIEELAISGLAAVAWILAGQLALGVALAGLSLAHHALVYALGGRLLKG